MVWVLYFHCSIPFGSLRAAHEWGRAAPWPPETPRPGQGSCQRSQGGSEPAVSDRGRTTALAHAWKCKRRHATRGPGLPASPPPHRLLGDREAVAVAARRPRRGRGKAGGRKGRPASGRGRRRRGARGPGEAEGSGVRGGSGGGHFLTAASSVTTATTHGPAPARHVARGARPPRGLGPRTGGGVYGGGGG